MRRSGGTCSPTWPWCFFDSQILVGSGRERRGSGLLVFRQNLSQPTKAWPGRDDEGPTRLSLRWQGPKAAGPRETGCPGSLLQGVFGNRIWLPPVSARSSPEDSRRKFFFKPLQDVARGRWRLFLLRRSLKTYASFRLGPGRCHHHRRRQSRHHRSRRHRRPR